MTAAPRTRRVGWTRCAKVVVAGVSVWWLCSSVSARVLNGSELALRQATMQDWPAIEQVLRTDPRVVSTKARLPHLKAQLREDPRYRFYVFEQRNRIVGFISVLVGSELTFQPFYVASSDIRFQQMAPLLAQILSEEHKDGRAVIDDAYREVIPVLKAACGNRVDVRPLTDQQDLFEVTIRYSDLLSGVCQSPA